MRSRTCSWVKTGEDALQSADVARHRAALPHATDDATRQRATRRTPSEHADGDGGVSRRACRGRAKSKASQSVARAHPARSLMGKSAVRRAISFIFAPLIFLTETISFGYVLANDMMYDALMRFALRLVEMNVVPDFLLRKGIRFLLAQRLRELKAPTGEEQQRRLVEFVADLKRRPIAEQTGAANEQHYEVPTELYLLCLGKHLKYSSCLYEGLSPRCGLDAAEAAMLTLYCERAQLADGQRILELGCGWGSMSLFMAARYPNASVTVVSNSRTQKQFIDERAAERGITNLTVVTANMADESFAPPKAGSYDRIVSIEMFEHMKNYSLLMRRCASWLTTGGALFVHIFVHKEWPYHFEARGEDDWMARYFFSGGTMPSDALLLYFQEGGLAIESHWRVNGGHYALTSEDWLKNLDRNTSAVLPILEKTYGKPQRTRWLVYWRLFFLSCAEMFAYNNGEEWYVSHYLFRKRAV